MAAPTKYPDELRDRAVRMVMDLRRDPLTPRGALARVGQQLGINTSDLRDRLRPLVHHPHRTLAELRIELTALSGMTTPHSACLHESGGGSN